MNGRPMKKNYYVSILFFLLFIASPVAANPTITVFFEQTQEVEKVSQKLRKPGKLAKHTVRHIIQHVPVAGILVTYGGYIATSSFNGEIIFPRAHQKSSVTILVTPEMMPIALFENTLLHWKLIPGMPAKMYTCEQKYNEAKSQYYWDVKEVPLPEDNVIPLSALVIIADPKNIELEIGETPTNETANLILPDIQVKKGINIIKNSSYMLTVRHLFKPIETEERREPFKVLTHIIE